MTVRRLVVIQCDGCERESDWLGEDVAHAREQAARDGWVRVWFKRLGFYRDLCSTCESEEA